MVKTSHTVIVRQLLVAPKDKTPKEDKCGVIYHISCQGNTNRGPCRETYIGETKRSLKTRFLEHRRPSSAASEVSQHIHIESPGHSGSRGAIKCMLDLGVRPALIPWICSFISDRRQRVCYQGKHFDWLYLTCGVAQGTVLGPIISLSVIDSALRDVTDRWKYVDDMNLALTRTLRQPCSLQPTLNNLNDWTTDDKMTMNPKNM
ncbi:hypothetical protein Bbelb_020540 [Branchiostoma belcheri]|nr:hypothetical protein Bbelb_020540 [Branchiostoma belcheri]